MSLTATLLLKQPITLPVGTLRCISSDDRRRAHVTKNEEIRTANTELVFSAIEAGAETIAVISRYANLSELTVQKAVNDLEDNGRIVRDKSKPKHRFAVKGKA